MAGSALFREQEIIGTGGASMKVDYHIHTSPCGHAKVSVPVCKAAVEAGIEKWVSDHPSLSSSA